MADPTNLDEFGAAFREMTESPEKFSWAEWNIRPDYDHDVFLLDVIQPFVTSHEVGSWHFFWEWGEGDDPEEEVLRFRVHGSGQVHREFRDHLKEKDDITLWYEGAHGVRGKSYDGEENFYGKLVWEKTYRLWHAHSELALLLAVQSVAGRLERPKSMHWRRTAHLACNQLELPDIRMCLEQAQRYLYIFPQMTGRDVTSSESRLLAELDRYLYPPEHI